MVVRASDDGCVVSILDPQIMAGITGHDQLRPIADEASRRLSAALDTIAMPSGS